MHSFSKGLAVFYVFAYAVAVMLLYLSSLSMPPLVAYQPRRRSTGGNCPSDALNVDDIFISVKSSRHTHSRLMHILHTWWRFAHNVTYIFTDKDDKYLNESLGGHLINTGCPIKHNEKGLCCKMSTEYYAFMASGKRWFCHMDDDNYVNIPALLHRLQEYDSTEDWYLGKPSIPRAWHKASNDSWLVFPNWISYQFAHGGAGFCISINLAIKMHPYMIPGRLESLCSRMRVYDDVVLGFIITHHFRVSLTEINDFHSHYEKLKTVQVTNRTITLSYGGNRPGRMNVVKIEGFSHDKDPTRFLSVHCKLNPDLEGCP